MPKVTVKEKAKNAERSSSRGVEHQELTTDELLKIEAFLKTLSGPLTPP